MKALFEAWQSLNWSLATLLEPLLNTLHIFKHILDLTSQILNVQTQTQSIGYTIFDDRTEKDILML